jgi:hypothetical protein
MSDTEMADASAPASPNGLNGHAEGANGDSSGPSSRPAPRV